MAQFVRRLMPVILCVGALTFLYLVTRLTNLTALPIFTDEAIYIRWSQIGARDAAWRFISLTDGKQPLFTWLVMGLLRFVQDPLLSGRLASVIAGAFGSAAVGLVSFALFRRPKTALVASLMYILSPFGLFYDRMALYDSLVAALSMWNLFLAILLVTYVRLDIALLLGLTLGAGMLNKTSGFLSLYMLPLTLVCFDFRRKDYKKRLLAWLGLAVVAALLSQAIYSVLRLSPFFYIIAQKDTVFVYPFSEWLSHPLRFVWGNLRGLFDWLLGYMSWPVFAASVIPLAVFFRNPREKLLLIAWWIIPFIALALFGKVLFPRFILFMTMPLFVLSALTVTYLWERHRRQVAGIALLVILFSPILYADYFIVVNPKYAPIPLSDRGQYIDDWPSGWGISEANRFLENEAEKGKVAVFTEGTFGLLPYALEIYLSDNPNIEIHGFWPLPKKMPPEIAQSALVKPTYVILNQSQEAPGAWAMSLIASYQKGTRKDRHLRIYKVVSPVAFR